MGYRIHITLACAALLAGCVTNNDLFEENAVAIQKLKNRIIDLERRGDNFERQLKSARVRIPSGVHAVESARKQEQSQSSEVSTGTVLDPGIGGYENALALYRAGDVDGAIRGLQQFIAGNARNEQAVIAQYWLGSAYYTKRNYTQALRHLGIFLKNRPQGEKTDLALEKLIRSLRAVGRNDDADILAKEGTNAIAH